MLFRLFIIVSLVGFFNSNHSEVFSQSNNVDIKLEKVQMALISGDLNLTTAILDTLLSSDSVNTRVWYFKGLSYRQAMNYKAAKNAFLVALSLDPGNIVIYKQMAQSCYDNDNFSTCLLYTDSILTIDSTNWSSLRIRALALQKTSRFQESKSVFLKLHKSDTLNTWYIKQLGGIATKIDSIQEAFDWYSLATDIDSMDMRSYIHQGSLLVKAERYKDGIAILTKAIERDSSHALLFRFRGSLGIMGADFSGAETDFRTAIELGDSAAFSFRHYGLCLFNQSKYKEAMPIYETATDLDKGDPLAWYYLGFCFKWQQDLDKALECLDKALKLSATKGLPDVYDALGQFHGLQRNYKLAMHNYSRAYEWNPQNAVPLAQLGMLVEQSGGKKENAKTYYKSYLKNANPLKNAYLIDYVNKRMDIINEKLFMEGKLKREE